jgi:hypothetical protein
LVRRWRWAYGAGLLLGLLVTFGAQPLKLEPPALNRLAIFLKKPREKPPVWFSHKVHEAQRLACTQCHHEYQGRRNIWQKGQPVKRCHACHGLTPQASRPDLKNAFHRQCKGCHLKWRQQGRRAGPVDCLDCHRQA